MVQGSFVFDGGSNWLHSAAVSTIQFSDGNSCQLPPLNARETRCTTSASGGSGPGGREVGCGGIATGPGLRPRFAMMFSRNGPNCAGSEAGTTGRLAMALLSG